MKEKRGGMQEVMGNGQEEEGWGVRSGCNTYCSKQRSTNILVQKCCVYVLVGVCRGEGKRRLHGEIARKCTRMGRPIDSIMSGVI